SEIRATVFTQQVDMFYPILEVSKVYYVSNAQVKMARQQFSNLSNQYDLDFTDAGLFPFSVSVGYWYENTTAITGGSSSSSVDEFMPANVLEQAFYKTLQGFPILAGQLKTADSGRQYIEIDKDNLNMPVYTDTH
ncbi:Replication factor A protein 1, partial [Coemansia sp. RSA 2049]